MKHRTFLVLAIAASGFVAAPTAYAAFKCTTKNGVSYQDTPCAESQASNDIMVTPGKDGERAREAQRQRLLKEQELERQLTAKKTGPDQRKADEALEYSEWLERVAKKTDALKLCATGDVKCTPATLRAATLYLSESHLAKAIGAPEAKGVSGLARTTQWKMRVNDGTRSHVFRITAAWGLCSDEKDYLARNYGERACKVDIE